MIALLDPSIYELTDSERLKDEKQQYILQLQHIKYFKDILNYIIEKKKDGSLINFSLSQSQYYLLCNVASHPWNQYSKITQKNELIQTYNKVMQLIPNIVNLELNNWAIPLDKMNEFSGTSCFEDFCKHITYIYNNRFDYVVFYGRLNSIGKDIVKFKYNNTTIDLQPIYDITDNYNNSIRKILLSNPKYQITPKKDSPLPNIDLCKDFIKIRDDLIKSGNDSVSVYVKIGTEVALRNNYTYDTELSNFNSNNGCIRHIFRSNNKPYIYASIDIRHGNFEICDSSGSQIDEYTYCNNPQNKHDRTGQHNIKFERNRR